MKKVLIFMLSAALLFSMTACGKTQNSDSNSSSSGTGAASGSVNVTMNPIGDNSTPTFNDDEVLNNLTTTTYTWNDSYNYYVALVIKNNSALNCNLSANVLFKNANNELIGAADNSIDAFEANSEMCLVFSNEEEFVSFDYEYEASKLDYYDCISSSLSCETSVTPKKCITSITNNGEKTAKYVQYRVLFMQGENVVYSDWGYATDDDSEIKPGKTITKESTFYNSKKDFDNVKVYYTGRADKS